MSDPLSTHPVRAPEPQDEADREARIDELLLSGLDHYFAGQYERAISVWTRIVFLDRHHDRARAYIERARSALAERQRESDESLHDGLAAYNAGDIERARSLLTQAVEQGRDSAAVFLERLNRLGPVGRASDGRTEHRPSRVTGRASLAPRRREWVAGALAASVVAVLMLIGGLPIGQWLSELEVEPALRTPPQIAEESLPVVRAADMAIVRARSLQGQGRLREALGALDRVQRGDPLRAEADRMRSDIQRELLAAAAASVTIDAGGRP